MKIVIPGCPVPQARMKHARRGNFVTTYDPRAKEKEHIRTYLRDNLGYNLSRFESWDTAYPRVSFMFHMPIPASIRKKDQDLYQSGTLKHDKKPDTDNLVKLYLDCLDGIVLDGDQKVSIGPCIKLYHPNPKTIVWISPTQRTLSPWEVDFAFLSDVEPEIPCFSQQHFPCDSESLYCQVLGLFDRKINPHYAIAPLIAPAGVPLRLE